MLKEENVVINWKENHSLIKKIERKIERESWMLVVSTIKILSFFKGGRRMILSASGVVGAIVPRRYLLF